MASFDVHTTHINNDAKPARKPARTCDVDLVLARRERPTDARFLLHRLHEAEHGELVRGAVHDGLVDRLLGGLVREARLVRESRPI